jgi:small ligand-binding sensory domain FIST
MALALAGDEGGSMRWASTLSERPDAEGAAAEASEALWSALGGAPDLAFLFCSDAYAADYARLAERVVDRLGGGLLIGCSGRSVIGAGREIEGHPAVSIVGAHLPKVSLAPVRIAGDGFPRGAEAWREAFELPPDPAPSFVLLADPWSCDAESLIRQLEADFPASAKVGGLASGAEQPGENALFLGHRLHRDGLVGVALAGDVRVDSVVAQGCRPIGHPMFVTRCRGQLLVELDGRPPIQCLQELFEQGSPRDRALMQSSLFLGIEMRPELSEYRRGDFLIRNLAGADPGTGVLAVAAALREGLVVQFHLRDAQTSAEDLEERLAGYRPGPGGAPAGALLFSCLGRGAPLYGRPNHDSDVFRRHLGPIPLGGFFCNGEIGPVAQRTFLHGYTSAFGIFRPRAQR